MNKLVLHPKLGYHLPMYNSSIKQRIRKQYLIHAIIPLSITVLLFILFTLVSFKGALRLTNSRDATSIANNFSEIMDGYRAGISKLSSLEATRDIVFEPNNEEAAREVFTEFYAFLSHQKVKSTLVILGSRSNIVLTSSKKDITFSQMLSFREMESRIDRTDSGIIGETNYMKLEINKESVFTFASRIIEGSQIIGHVFLLLHKDDVLNELFSAGVNVSVLVDEFDTVIATTNTSLIQAWNKFRPNASTEGNLPVGSNEFTIAKREVPNSSLSVYCLSTLKPQTTLITLLFLFVLGIMMISFFLIRKMGNDIAIKTTQPVDRMIEAIKGFQKGDMEAYVTIYSDDEFQLLGDQYNKMLKRISTLIAKNTELQEIRRMSELKLLESQFNPHFMFNVLECIRYEILIEHEKAQDTVLALSNLLRYSVKEMNEFVLLSDDLQYIHNFLKLHKVRAGDRLTYTFDMQEGLERLLVPRLIIQPLVENSVKYGFQKQMELCINISGRLQGEEDMIVFTVSDNGGGMDEALLKKINDMIDSKGTMIEKDGIGIYNLYRRILLMFGEKGKIEFGNIAGGLTAKIEIPVWRSQSEFCTDC
ncbi:MAG: histidine kinase [Sphaerochaeta sp.]|nr:histidine kinase [Sphaerochaeta sp.]